MSKMNGGEKKLDIENSIKFFNETYPELTKEREELDSAIVSIFEKKLEEIRPIIKLMKDKQMFFFHPDLSNELCTTHGVILGRNRRNNAEIYVFNGNHYLQKIDAHNDKVLDEASLPISHFFKMCDREFAIKGIDHIRNYLPELLDILGNQNNEKRLFIEKHSN